MSWSSICFYLFPMQLACKCIRRYWRRYRIDYRSVDQFFGRDSNHSRPRADILGHHSPGTNRGAIANFHVLQNLCPGPYEHAPSQFNSAGYVNHWIERATVTDHSLMGDGARHINKTEWLKPNVHGNYGARTDDDTLTSLRGSSLPFDTWVDKCRPCNIREFLYKFFRKLEPYRRGADPHSESIDLV